MSHKIVTFKMFAEHELGQTIVNLGRKRNDFRVFYSGFDFKFEPNHPIFDAINDNPIIALKNKLMNSFNVALSKPKEESRIIMGEFGMELCKYGNWAEMFEAIDKVYPKGVGAPLVARIHDERFIVYSDNIRLITFVVEFMNGLIMNFIGEDDEFIQNMKYACKLIIR